MPKFYTLFSAGSRCDPLFESNSDNSFLIQFVDLKTSSSVVDYSNKHGRANTRTRVSKCSIDRDIFNVHLNLFVKLASCGWTCWLYSENETNRIESTTVHLSNANSIAWNVLNENRTGDIKKHTHTINRKYVDENENISMKTNNKYFNDIIIEAIGLWQCGPSTLFPYPNVRDEMSWGAFILGLMLW